jgi:hypothetical protein
MITAAAVLGLISLHGPGHQLIIINPASIVRMRTPREHNESYLHESANCVLSMNNGKLISVVENCDRVRAAIEGAEDGRTPP